MRAYDIIAKKRDGLENSHEELRFLLDGYVADRIHDDQMAAWLMAVYLRGMNARETADLTELMMASGEVLDLSGIDGVVVDKHSTGGVGDKTTLIVAPMVAAAGVPVAKLSGKGLGFTGGTIDKLESIPGLRTAMTNDDFIHQVNTIGLAVIGQTQNLVPADKKMYALRDVTATVESIPLIASSVMSKKLAAGAAKILLDVKFGSGSFMKTPEQARMLARTMVTIGQRLGAETVAVLSSMEQPLGQAVGNALEVLEALDILRGKGPNDLRALTITLAAEMLCLNGRADSRAQGEAIAQEMIATGAAYRKFLEMVAWQGGDVRAVERGTILEDRQTQTITSVRSGYLSSIDTEKIGHCSMLLGAGRERKEDAIDLSAGLRFLPALGQWVSVGDPLAILYYSNKFADKAKEAEQILLSALHFAENPPAETPLIAEIIRA